MPTRGTTSVLIPAFNRGAQLAATVRSILDQTVPPTEIIVVDDGSTDDTRQVMGAFLAECAQSPTRVEYLWQPNQGKSVALNLALAHATGDWIAYDDSDDLWRPDKLEWQWRALEAFPDCAACVTDAAFVNDPEMRVTAFGRAGRSYPNVIGKIDDPVAMMVHPPHGVFMQTVLVRRGVMNLVGEFDARLWVGQDTDFLFRLAQRTPLCYVNLPLVEIDRSTGRNVGLMSQFGRRSQRRLQSLELIYEKWLRLLDSDRREARESVEKLLGSLHSEISNMYLLQGKPDAARSAVRRGLKLGFSGRLLGKLLLLWVAPGFVARRVRQVTG